MTDTCIVCGMDVGETDRLVLVRGKLREAYCSESCLRRNVRRRRVARAAEWRRWIAVALVIAVLPPGARILWHRYRAPQPEVIASGPPDDLPAAAPSGPVAFGPAWPPTDADWIVAFNQTSWTYPLPGPTRRTPTIDGRIFGPEPPREHPASCRVHGRCGVDLGGELWGEHVYAVHDGVVDRVHRGGNEERGGQYVRLSHFGGMVFTQYFHLAATPRTLSPGARVMAGDVIGLLGDTGIGGARRHLHFALSIRPSPKFSEVYWDPGPWMEDWALRTPPRGTVAGLAAAEKKAEIPRRRRWK